VSDQAVRSPEGERRRVLLEFWGDAPTEFGNLAPEIHDAFAIPPVTGVEPVSAAPLPAPRSPQAPEPDAAPAVKQSVRKRLQEIDDWNGRLVPMSQGLANELRKVVHAAVTARITWIDPAVRRPPDARLEKAWPATALSISIEDARENRPSAVPPTIRFARSPSNARFFQDLVRWEQEAGPPSVDARARLDEIAERHAPVVKRIVLDHMGRSDAALGRALWASLAGSALGGVARPGDPSPALLDGVLTAEMAGRTDDNVRCESWRRAESSHRQARSDFVTELRRSLGAAQGTGEVETIDAVRALRLLADATESWEPGDDRRGPEWAVQATRPLTTLRKTVDEQLDALDGLVTAIRDRLPRGTGFAETATAVQQAILAGEGHGHVPVRDVPGLKERNAAAAEAGSSRDLERLESDLRQVQGAPFETRLAVAARDRGPGLGLMRDFLTENEDWLDAGLARAEVHGDEEAADLVSRVQDVVERWRGIVAEGS
jgi:hypothetical protein